MRYYYKTLDGRGILSLKKPKNEPEKYVPITKEEFEAEVERRKQTEKSDNRVIADKPSKLDRIEAQTLYTAIMTDTLIDEEK